MPLTTLHLLAFTPGRTATQYVRALRSQSISPLVTSKVIRWIIKPEKLSTHLLNQKWDLLLILPASTKLPDSLLGDEWVHRHWSITAGVPKSLLQDFGTKNERLLHPREGDVPKLGTGELRMAKSTQGLELNEELLGWSQSGSKPPGAVSMLNLLSFLPTKEAHESYLKYGKAFGEEVGKKRDGNAKVVGRVVPDQGTRDEDKYGWDEIALAHYPSVEHFVDMLGGEDYQGINHKWRLPALRDTCILCTSEVVFEEEEGKEGKAKF